ncbi:MAG TPA: carboxypeptidase regulatory-like domain-containing protein, partial [Candidatus Hydrogenedentes bacterium]|nr:carboxypeptidase regulatory-like domain-containing protein [Candidatus Hydrogenedentota bacterium]
GDDGSYELVLPLEERTTIEIGAMYVAPATLEEAIDKADAPAFDVEPGEEREHSFTVDAPATAPVRVVDEDGVALPDIVLLLESATRGSSGGPGFTSTDAEGRFTFFGVPPNHTYVIRAHNFAMDWQSGWLGSSQPFTGEPGETLPEIVIVCEAKGALEGVFTDAEGKPVPNMHLGCWLRMPDGTLKGVPGANTDANGHFILADVSPEGFYSEILIACKRSDLLEMAFVRNVEIAVDVVTDLGVIVAEPISKEQEAALFRK